MIYDLSVTLMPEIRKAASRRSRLKALLDTQRKIARDSEYWRTLYDLLPHIIRDRRLHARFAVLMNSYYQEILESLDLADEDGFSTRLEWSFRSYSAFSRDARCSGS